MYDLIKHFAKINLEDQTEGLILLVICTLVCLLLSLLDL